MKTAFEINGEEPAAADTHALLEVGEYGMSALRFRKEPFSIDAISTYNFPEDSHGTISEKFRKIISDNAFASQANVHVFFNFREALLIPDEFMRGDTYAAQLNLVYGISPGDDNAYDEFVINPGSEQPQKLFCVYRIPGGLVSVVKEISLNRPMHSTSVQIQPKAPTALHCTIFYNTIKIFLYVNNQLQLVNQYTYKTPADVVYHLLNACDKHEVSPSEIDVFLDGMIDVDSSLYQEIYKYFLHVYFNVIADDVVLSSGIKEHPLHFITHLTALARCV